MDPKGGGAWLGAMGNIPAPATAHPSSPPSVDHKKSRVSDLDERDFEVVVAIPPGIKKTLEAINFEMMKHDQVLRMHDGDIDEVKESLANIDALREGQKEAVALARQALDALTILDTKADKEEVVEAAQIAAEAVEREKQRNEEEVLTLREELTSAVAALREEREQVKLKQEWDLDQLRSEVRNLKATLDLFSDEKKKITQESDAKFKLVEDRMTKLTQENLKKAEEKLEKTMSDRFAELKVKFESDSTRIEAIAVEAKKTSDKVWADMRDTNKMVNLTFESLKNSQAKINAELQREVRMLKDSVELSNSLWRAELTDKFKLSQRLFEEALSSAKLDLETRLVKVEKETDTVRTMSVEMVESVRRENEEMNERITKNEKKLTDMISSLRAHLEQSILDTKNKLLTMINNTDKHIKTGVEPRIQDLFVRSDGLRKDTDKNALMIKTYLESNARNLTTAEESLQAMEAAISREAEARKRTTKEMVDRQVSLRKALKEEISQKANWWDVQHALWLKVDRSDVNSALSSSSVGPKSNDNPFASNKCISCDLPMSSHNRPPAPPSDIPQPPPPPKNGTPHLRSASHSISPPKSRNSKDEYVEVSHLLAQYMVEQKHTRPQQQQSNDNNAVHISLPQSQPQQKTRPSTANSSIRKSMSDVPSSSSASSFSSSSIRPHSAKPGSSSSSSSYMAPSVSIPSLNTPRAEYEYSDEENKHKVVMDLSLQAKNPLLTPRADLVAQQQKEKDAKELLKEQKEAQREKIMMTPRPPAGPRPASSSSSSAAPPSQPQQQQHVTQRPASAAASNQKLQLNLASLASALITSSAQNRPQSAREPPSAAARSWSAGWKQNLGSNYQGF